MRWRDGISVHFQIEGRGYWKKAAEVVEEVEEVEEERMEFE